MVSADPRPSPTAEPSPSRPGAAVVRNLGRAVLHAGASVRRILWSVWPFLLAGLAIRFILAPITLNEDLVVFSQASLSMLYGGGPYSSPSVYPPLWLLYLNVIGHITSVFVPGPGWLTTNNALTALYYRTNEITPEYAVNIVFVLFLKGSLFLWDIATGVLIYVLAVRVTGRADVGPKAFALWFLNPLTIVVSSVHGTFDVIPTFFVLLALLFALERQALFSGLSTATGILFKLYPGVLIPLLLVILWRAVPGASRRVRLRATGWFLLGVGILPAIVFLPPGLLEQFLTLSTVGPRGAQQNYGGWGYWGFFSIPQSQPVRAALHAFALLDVIVLGTVAVVLVCAVAFLYWHRTAGNRRTSDLWIPAASLSLMASFLIPTVVQPQYTLWIVPFLVLFVFFDRWGWAFYLTLSILPALFYFTLLGGAYLMLLPLSFTYHVVPFSVYSASTLYWIHQGATLYWALLPPFSAVLVLFTYLLLRRLNRRPTAAPTVRIEEDTHEPV